MRIHRLLILFAGAVLMAQTPPEPGPRAGAVKEALGLTDDQVTELVELRKQERETLRTVSQQVREKSLALRQAVNAGADAATVGALTLEIHTLRQQIHGVNEQFHNNAVGLLNADQLAKLKQLEEAAKLRPAIGAATALNLLQPPRQGLGGPAMFQGPGGRGISAMGPGGGMRGPAMRGQR